MYRKFIKRFLDIVLSGCALIVLSPLILAIEIYSTRNIEENRDQNF